MTVLKLTSIDGLYREDVRARWGDRLKDEQRDTVVTGCVAVRRDDGKSLILWRFKARAITAQNGGHDPFWRGRHRCFMRVGPTGRDVERP